MIKWRYLLLILVLVSISATTVYYYVQQLTLSEKIYTGFRIMGSEGFYPTFWVNLTKQMASRIPSTSPGCIWIVGRIDTSLGTCILSFPSNQKYSNISFESRDKSEHYLTAFDNSGIKIWLQVEPGFADVDQLIDLVLKRYGNYSCVLGFGIDLEWRWGWPRTYETVSVTDVEAERWVNKIKQYNSSYRLFLKHWRTNFMPPIAREDIVFIDDAQDFEGLEPLVNEFKGWGQNFSQTDVGFQIGYKSDKWWWSQLENPPRDIGLALIKNIPNCRFLFWTDETIADIYALLTQ